MKIPKYHASFGSLLSNKLNPSRPPPSQISRTSIRDHIVSTVTAKLILLQAPAGFGKSTTMAQCLEYFEHEGIATAWLNLEEADNDIQRLLTCILAAISGFTKKGSGNLDSVDPINHHKDQALDVVSQLASCESSFVLFLDDFERIHEPAALGLIREIIDHLPDSGRLVIGSRNRPELGLGRLRARGMLLEIGTELMRFTVEETSQYLTSARHLLLSQEDLARIHTKTEGWVAALWLASLALENHPAPADFIGGFSGEYWAIAEYLAEDVLAQQPSQVRAFLLRTSILRYLSAPLCNALLPDMDSDSLLNLLNEANIFLQPVEGEERQYRYHSLFADFLSAQLERQFPQEVPNLHHAASVWFEANNRPVPAISHALDSHDYQRALNLLKRHGEELLSQGRMRLLARWFNAIPPARLSEYPLLQAIHVWALCSTCNPQIAMDLLHQTGLEHSTDPKVRPHVRALRTFLLCIMDDFEQANAYGRDALEKLPNTDLFTHGTLVNCVAHSYSVLGKFQKARHLLDEARDVNDVCENAFNSMYAESVEGLIDLQEGRQRQAGARFRLAVTMTHTNKTFSFNGVSGNAFAGILHAYTVYESNDLAMATRLLNVYAPLARNIGLSDHVILGDVMLARIAFHKGDIDKAFQILAKLELTGHQRHLPRVVATARLQRAQLMLLQGNEGAAKVELERADDRPTWERVKRLHLLANDVDTSQIGWLRWEAFVGDVERASKELTVLIGEAKDQSRHRRALKLRLFKAIVLYRKQQLTEALSELEKILRIGCREGYIRMFLDEGPYLGTLVARLQADMLERKVDRREPLFAEYLQKVVRGFGPAMLTVYPSADEMQSHLLDPLTPKEIRVLKLLAEGLSNSAMAEKLFVSDSTVRTHLRNINSKLNARSRTEAVAIARKARVI